MTGMEMLCGGIGCLVAGLVAGELSDVHLSAVGNRLNEVMKVLTSWAGIILVPTLLAGIWGMNFVHMPELQWRYGYAFALLMMLGSGVGLWTIFKRRGWL